MYHDTQIHFLLKSQRCSLINPCFPISQMRTMVLGHIYMTTGDFWGFYVGKYDPAPWFASGIADSPCQTWSCGEVHYPKEIIRKASVGAACRWVLGVIPKAGAWNINGISWWFQWDFNGISWDFMVFQWDFMVVSMGFQWDFNGISWC